MRRFGLTIAGLVCVFALGVLPSVWAHDGDFDDDGFADAVDNCPSIANDQADADGNDIGDVCQCGDVSGDGSSNTVDALMIARGEVGAEDPHFHKCDVNGDGHCNSVDALMIARGELTSDPAEQQCPAALPPPCGESFPSTFDAIQHQIFENPAYGGCNNFVCHSPAFGAPQALLDLTEGTSYSNLVGSPLVFSTTSPEYARVQPGDECLSLLYLKVLAKLPGGLPPNCPPDGAPLLSIGTPMPNSGSALSQSHLEALRLWIRGGAPMEGVVEGTAELLDSCLPDPTPSEVVAPAPPPADVGVQFHMPLYDIEEFGEREICQATYYDYRRRCQAGADQGKLCSPGSAPVGCDCRSAQVPEASIDPSGQWLFYRDFELTQPSNSHHSINTVYVPFPNGITGATNPSTVDDPVWGDFTCKGGENDGEACDPRDPTNCPGSCSTPIVDAIACIGWGPPDSEQNSLGYSGAQQPYSSANYPSGVYAILPLEGILTWNSHAFNLTSAIQPMESWVNIFFAGPEDQVFPARGIFNADQIWKIGELPVPVGQRPLVCFLGGPCNWVLPFERGRACNTNTLPRYSRLFELSSHFHRRGVLFEIFDPSGQRIFASTEYSDPVVLGYSPPVALDSASSADRRYEYCATWDNGFTDPADVKRASTTPANALPPVCTPTHCAEGLVPPSFSVTPCSTDADCDTTLGAGDGACDACPLWGGISTEDEMFILLGTYYLDAP